MRGCPPGERERLQEREAVVLRFIFLDSTEPPEDRVFSGAHHHNSLGGVPQSASLPSPIF